ncbi:unnamed protein product [Zymoseptoria tritici ST99CH_1E4]|uniref:Uncharacterized protein n=1 Tax=Zymoseptoria tritici ST99CH_1E4 TaxID=1276532 RepID=A0A2H1FKP7_ZYMTR|nr:unnamed protein product [Zymoseptoria tritici ST99CH_1E4]
MHQSPTEHKSSDDEEEAPEFPIKSPANEEEVFTLAPETQPKPQASLLSIAAELRNRIYQDVLLTDQTTQVTPALHEHALVSTCRQIRTEARRMWFIENRFLIVVTDCDAQLAERWFRLLMTARLPSAVDARMTMRWLGKPHWANLMRWCKTIYDHRRPPLFDDLKMTKNTLVAVAVTAVRLVWSGRFQSWPVCQRALEALRGLAGILDEDWLVDH